MKVKVEHEQMSCNFQSLYYYQVWKRRRLLFPPSAGYTQFHCFQQKKKKKFQSRIKNNQLVRLFRKSTSFLQENRVKKKKTHTRKCLYGNFFHSSVSILYFLTKVNFLKKLHDGMKKKTKNFFIGLVDIFRRFNFVYPFFKSKDYSLVFERLLLTFRIRSKKTISSLLVTNRKILFSMFEYLDHNNCPSNRILTISHLLQYCIEEFILIPISVCIISCIVARHW